jgi:hypothetical protein
MVTCWVHHAIAKVNIDVNITRSVLACMSLNNETLSIVSNKLTPGKAQSPTACKSPTTQRGFTLSLALKRRRVDLAMTYAYNVLLEL